MWILGADEYDQPHLVNLDQVTYIYGHSNGVALGFQQGPGLELANVAGLENWRALDHLAEVVGAAKPEVDPPRRRRRTSSVGSDAKT